MEILHISAECYPVAKVGGLADVVGALPKYQNKNGCKSKVIMPFYNNKFTQDNNFKTVFKSKLILGYASFNFSILTLKNSAFGFELYCVDIPELLYKDYVYSQDDTERFLSFQIAVLNWIKEQKTKPDIIHCHDHHTGLIPFMVSHSQTYDSLKSIPTILTIHNAQYQGWFSHDRANLLPSFDFSKVGLLDWDGSVNPLAAAIKCAWKVTTVSPSYMEELKKNANGLENLLSHEHKKCVGILNGIDTDVWNPETDTFVVKNFTPSSVRSGKKANKKWLCDTFELDEKKPLFVFIGRLVGEKGSDMFPQVFDAALNNQELSILLLGSGNTDTEKQLEKLIEKHKGTYSAFLGYDEKLSHKMYAGADFLLMPSRVEPCGLNQMYALRYGTVPIVHSIGGLKDTVIDILDNGGFGICHQDVSEKSILTAISRAINYYKNQEKFNKNRKSIMAIDHSWNSSANEYIKLYTSIK